MLMISELLGPGRIQLELKGADKAAVLGELVELVPEVRGDASQREGFLQALLEREKLHTTGIGDGIALPHARTPLGGIIKQPSLAFGRHSAGIEFGCPDKKPVQLLFLIASPNLTEHLAMLARLSRLLRDVRLRSQLLAVKMADEALGAIREAESRLPR